MTNAEIGDGLRRLGEIMALAEFRDWAAWCAAASQEMNETDNQRGGTNFAQITATPEALAEFLRGLPALSGPWDEAFYRAFCDSCPAEDCDGCDRPERDNPLWWLLLPAAEVSV